MSFVKGMYVILFALFFALQTPAYAESLNRVAATVNEEIITSHELDTRLHQILVEQPNIPGSKNALRHQVLDMLVLESIERQQSLKTGISVDEQTVDQLITTIAKNHQMTVPQWKETLLAQGMDLSAYREQVRLEAMRSRLYE
ncbi:MAG: SurA N-terminal domain-containing protein, partial [Pseudomonadota bacterium]